MSFRSVLSHIEQDISIGLEVATPIVGTFNPAIGLILGAIGKGLAILEKKNTDPEKVSPVIQAISTNCAVMQHAGVCSGNQNCTACCCPSPPPGW
jgi:hypothetical protein